MTGFDELWGEQMRAMERAQTMFDAQRREVTLFSCTCLCTDAASALLNDGCRSAAAVHARRLPPSCLVEPGPMPASRRPAAALRPRHQPPTAAQMEQQFEAVEREAQASGSGRQAVEEHHGPCGYRWQRSYSRNGPGGCAPEGPSQAG